MFKTYALLLVLCAFCISGNAGADYPSLPLTIELGPNAEDFNSQYEGGLTTRSIRSALHGFDLSGRDLRISTLHLEAMELRDVNFDGADLTGSDLRETHFVGCSSRNANLRRVNLFGSDIREDCELTGAEITGSTIWLPGNQLPTTRSYQRKDLSGCYIMGSFHGVSLAGFNLDGTRITHGLQGCDFSDASISDSVLTISKEQLVATRNYKNGDLSSTTFVDCDFSGVDFSDMSLGMFRKCNLSGADFTDAMFEPPTFQEPPWPLMRNGLINSPITKEQFYATWNYRRKLLPAGFEFMGINLRDWDFRGMNLEGVVFRAAGLSGARFDDARGGIFITRTVTAEQIKSTWNYKNNQMTAPGMHLHRDLAEEFSVEYHRHDLR